MTATILGPDVSHYQTVNFPQVKASGHSFVVLKATESVALARKRMAKLAVKPPVKPVRPSVTIDGVRHRLPMRFVDPTMAARRQQAHAAGLIVGLYHFARAGNAAAEAAYFLKTIGTLQVGEFVVLDWEVPAANPPTWCKQWLDAIYAATGVRPLIYMNSSAMTGSNWSAVAADYGLWLAKYDNSTAQPAVKWWGAAAMKQYSDRGTVPGIGACDVDVFYGTEAQLLKYGKQAGPTPAPKPSPTVQEDDMRLIQQTDRGIAVVGPGYYCGLSPAQVGPAVAAWGNPVVFQSTADFDAAVTVATGGTGTGILGALIGYGARIERIDEGAHGGWGYGARIEDTQAKVAALAAGGPATVDPTALAAALAANGDFISKLADALVKRTPA